MSFLSLLLPLYFLGRPVQISELGCIKSTTLGGYGYTDNKLSTTLMYRDTVGTYQLYEA